MDAPPVVVGEVVDSPWRIVEKLMTPIELMCMLNARAVAADLPLWTLQDCTKQLALQPLKILVRVAA